MKITILTLFPSIIEAFLNESIIKRSIEKGVAEVKVVDIRDYSKDKHHHVDDTPYGGGAGMILKVDVVHEALMANSTSNTYKIITSPKGNTFNQAKALDLANKDEILILCGHYEGIDERIINFIDEEISVGDYILTGGEVPALIIIDSVIRLLKGAINEESIKDETFSNNLLEYPQFTRPSSYLGLDVPEVLLSGNHENIRQYRLYESLKATYLKRRDLLTKVNLTTEMLKMLENIKKTINNK